MDFERKQRKDFGQVNKFNFIYWSSEIENMLFQTHVMHKCNHMPCRSANAVIFIVMHVASNVNNGAQVNHM